MRRSMESHDKSDRESQPQFRKFLHQKRRDSDPHQSFDASSGYRSMPNEAGLSRTNISKAYKQKY
jgi:hypothetical protein